jgi:hypothetical protein
MLVRHGTRNPSAEVITEMKVRLPELRDQILKSHNEQIGKRLNVVKVHTLIECEIRII